MALTKIVMHLARNPKVGVVAGDREHGYALVAPLNSKGLLDEAGWDAHRGECLVHAFAPGEPVREGRLSRRGHSWFFDYDRTTTSDDEPVFKLENHKFVVGEYVTITDKADEPLVYRISTVEALR